MKKHCKLAVMVVALAEAGCGCVGNSARTPDEATSQSASSAPAADLRKVADDRQAAREERAAAIFALFANYLRPPRGPVEAGAALGEAEWLADCNLYEVRDIAGRTPVEVGGDGTAFCMHLFPVENGWSEWCIYLRLSGPDRSADDVRAFLRGNQNLAWRPELVEFALCHPGRNRTDQGRVERFGPEGLMVVDFGS